MNPPKATDTSSARSSTTTTPVSNPQAGRKPWVKKSPVQVILSQIEKVRENVAKKKGELKQEEKQLQKLEEARKLLESA